MLSVCLNVSGIYSILLESGNLTSLLVSSEEVNLNNIYFSYHSTTVSLIAACTLELVDSRANERDTNTRKIIATL